MIPTIGNPMIGTKLGNLVVTVVVLETAGNYAKLQRIAPHLPTEMTIVSDIVVDPIHTETAIQITPAIKCKVFTHCLPL